MSTRRTVELRSGPALVLLGRAPKALPFLLVVVLLVGGLALHTVIGALLLLALLAFAAWVTYLAWPVLQPPARAVRVLVLLLLAGAAAVRL